MSSHEPTSSAGTPLPTAGGGLDRTAPIIEGGEPLPSDPPTQGDSPEEVVGSRHEYRGVVINVTPPVPGTNPFLVSDVRLDSGETVVLRGMFLTAPLRVPHLAEGQVIRFSGRPTRRGYIRPTVIVNESSGVRWHRASRFSMAVLALVVLASAVLFIRWGAMDDNPPRPGPGGTVVVPDVVGKSLSEARFDLSNAGLRNVAEVGEPSGEPIFTVVRVDPPAGTTVGRDAAVKMFFSFPI